MNEAKVVLERTLRPGGWNVGPVVGEAIPFVHLHVIPRFADEPLVGRGIRYPLKQPANGRP